MKNVYEQRVNLFHTTRKKEVSKKSNIQKNEIFIIFIVFWHMKSFYMGQNVSHTLILDHFYIYHWHIKDTLRLID